MERPGTSTRAPTGVSTMKQQLPRSRPTNNQLLYAPCSAVPTVVHTIYAGSRIMTSSVILQVQGPFPMGTLHSAECADRITSNRNRTLCFSHRGFPKGAFCWSLWCESKWFAPSTAVHPDTRGRTMAQILSVDVGTLRVCAAGPMQDCAVQPL